MLPNIMNIDHTKESTYSKSFKPSDVINQIQIKLLFIISF